VAPPRVAPVQVVIVPIWKTDEEKSRILESGVGIKGDLEQAGLRVEFDTRDNLKPGAKYFEWEALGVPVRLEVGPRDLASGQAMLARRTGGKGPIPLQGLAGAVTKALDEIQAGLLKAATERREKNSTRGVTKAQFVELMQSPSGGGFAYGGFCGKPSCEAEIKEQTAATIRVLPDPEFRSKEAPKNCMWCGAPSIAEAVWAQAY
jgi:prolyl-tRNA synthetase